MEICCLGNMVLANTNWKCCFLDKTRYEYSLYKNNILVYFVEITEDEVKKWDFYRIILTRISERNI